MKTNIISKAKADKITGARMKWDSGKYRCDQNYVGRLIDVSDRVRAVFPVIRKDADGHYVQLMAVLEGETR